MPKISEEQRQTRKQVILDSALELFSTKGYFPTSITDIAIHAAVSKGAIYTYFKSKEEIFLTLADNLHNISDRNKQFMNHINEGNLSLSEKLLSLWDDITAQWTEENLVFARLQYEVLLEASKSPELKQMMMARSKESLQLVQKIIHESIGESDPAKLAAFSRLWWAQIDGLVAYFISHGVTPDPEEMSRIRNLIQYMTNYLEE